MRCLPEKKAPSLPRMNHIMKRRWPAVFLVVLLPTVACLSPGNAQVVPTAEELARSHEWVKTHLTADQAGVPFSFVYDGRPSAECLSSWSIRKESRRLDDARTEHTQVWTDPRTRLVITCRAIEYADYPTVEWFRISEHWDRANTDPSGHSGSRPGLDTRE